MGFRNPLDLRKRRAVRVLTLVSTAVALVGSSMALAEETDPAPIVDEPAIQELPIEPPAPFDYRPDENVIVFSLPDADGLFIDCTEAIVVIEDDVLVTDLEGCSAAGTLGPGGQANHGQVVRAYVHSLKDLEYDGPRGHLVRNVARSNAGKQEPAAEGGDAGITEAGDSGGKAKGKNKPKPNRGRP